MTGIDQHGENAVEAQAAQWFARLKSLPVSRETLQRFFEWHRDAAHAAAFEVVERTWSYAGTLSDRPSIVAATRAALDRKQKRRTLSWPLHPAFSALAAVFLVLVGCGATYWAIRPSADDYATRIGQQSVIALDDGSKVTLDTDTRIVVRFDKDGRNVVIEHGQAYFTVAHDTSRPFRVEAGGTGILATGTQFGVRRDGPAVDVTLVEGSVRVALPGARSETMRSGQQLVARPDRATVVRGVDVDAATAWRHGRLVLDGWTLQQALVEVNRYSVHPVRLDDARFANSRLSGTFDVGDIDSFIAATTALLPLTAARQTDGSIRLVDRPMSRKLPASS